MIRAWLIQTRFYFKAGNWLIQSSAYSWYRPFTSELRGLINTINGIFYTGQRKVVWDRSQNGWEGLISARHNSVDIWSHFWDPFPSWWVNVRSLGIKFFSRQGLSNKIPTHIKFYIFTTSREFLTWISPSHPPPPPLRIWRSEGWQLNIFFNYYIKFGN